MRAVGSGRTGPLLAVLIQVMLPAFRASETWSQNGPRLQLSHTEMRSRNSSAVFWHGGSSGGYQTLLLDEDRGWLLVGGRDHVYMLQAESLTQPMRKIHWPAGKEHTERCRHAGKNLSTDCANFVRLLQPFNKTHVYVCGTGAYHPQCTYIYLGHSVEEPAFTLLTHTVESGRGKCPFSPHESFTAQLTDGELYAGTSVDFMGNNAAIFRTSVHTSSQHYIRTEAYHDYWLNEPDFVGSYFIPDTHSLDDDKVYFFFKETAVESNQQDKRVYSRVARVCKNDIGGKRSLINRWSTFLKARLVCSVPGPGGMDTHFDELGTDPNTHTHTHTHISLFLNIHYLNPQHDLQGLLIAVNTVKYIIFRVFRGHLSSGDQRSTESSHLWSLLNVQLRLQRLRRLRLLHGLHPSRLQRALRSQRGPRLPLGGVQREDPVPAAWNCECSALRDSV
uniref:Si:dkey-49n23.1 n=1 Tax=Astyanax mexicanus TaxID=7994 RepID=A0A8B9KMV0_ASTMX